MEVRVHILLINQDDSPGSYSRLQDKALKWKSKIEAVWSNKVVLKPEGTGKCCCDGVNFNGCECEEIKVNFVVPMWCYDFNTTETQAEHDYRNRSRLGGFAHDHVVRVFPGKGRAKMRKWFFTSSGLVAAHEFGHMIGNMDEYRDRLFPKRTIYENSLMGDHLQSEEVHPRHFTRIAEAANKSLTACKCTYAPNYKF